MRHTYVPGAFEHARATLHAHFGYPDFRPPQVPAIEAAISGHDALIVLPTGGGKSLCYQVPALMREGLTVVVSPLISLMQDQVEALRRRGIAAAYLNSTLSAAEVRERLAHARDGTLRLLYVAPERLETGRLLHELADTGVALLAVDEAHCISEWGHDFRPSYRRLGEARHALDMPQVIALTATATPAVRRDIVTQLRLRDPTIVVGGFDRTNLAYHVVPVPHAHDRDLAAVQWLRRIEGNAVVYASTRTAVERVTAMLVRARIRATAYHAGLDAARRQRAQDAFMSARARVIVATNAFGMGIDKPDVRLVVHHTMPGCLEAYYQEAGRAGRDGQPGTCVLLHAPTDRATHEFFLAASHPPPQLVRDTWHVLRTSADASGFTALDAHGVAQRLRTRAPVPTVAAALRVLLRYRACTPVRSSPGQGHLRLLATPARIMRELAPRSPERLLLRACWRVAGPQLHDSAWVDLDALPMKHAKAHALVPLMERLVAQQIVMWMPSPHGLRLDARARDPQWMPVDWGALARRRRNDWERLDAMARYARADHCRRAFVLRYFGDPDVRDRCSACDRCVGLPP